MIDLTGYTDLAGREQESVPVWDNKEKKQSLVSKADFDMDRDTDENRYSFAGTKGFFMDQKGKIVPVDTDNFYNFYGNNNYKYLDSDILEAVATPKEKLKTGEKLRDLLPYNKLGTSVSNVWDAVITNLTFTGSDAINRQSRKEKLAEERLREEAGFVGGLGTFGGEVGGIVGATIATAGVGGYFAGAASAARHLPRVAKTAQTVSKFLKTGKGLKHTAAVGAAYSTPWAISSAIQQKDVGKGVETMMWGAMIPFAGHSVGRGFKKVGGIVRDKVRMGFFDIPKKVKDFEKMKEKLSSSLTIDPDYIPDRMYNKIASKLKPGEIDLSTGLSLKAKKELIQKADRSDILDIFTDTLKKANESVTGKSVIPKTKDEAFRKIEQLQSKAGKELEELRDFSKKYPKVFDLTGQEIIENLNKFIPKTKLENIGVEKKLQSSGIKGFITSGMIKRFVPDDYMKKLIPDKDLEKYITGKDLKKFISEKKLKKMVTTDDLKEYIKGDDLKKFMSGKEIKNLVPDNYFKRILSNKDVESLVSGKDLRQFVNIEDIKKHIPTDVLRDLIRGKDLKQLIPASTLKKLIPNEKLKSIFSKKEVQKMFPDFVKRLQFQAGGKTKWLLKDAFNADELKRLITDKRMESLIPDDYVRKLIPDEDLKKLIPDEDLKKLFSGDIKKIIPGSVLKKLIPQTKLKNLIPDDYVRKLIPDEELKRIIPSNKLKNVVPDEDLKDFVIEKGLGKYITGKDLKELIPSGTLKKLIPDKKLEEFIPPATLKKLINKKELLHMNPSFLLDTDVTALKKIQFLKNQVIGNRGYNLTDLQKLKSKFSEIADFSKRADPSSVQALYRQVYNTLAKLEERVIFRGGNKLRAANVADDEFPEVFKALRNFKKKKIYFCHFSNSYG